MNLDHNQDKIILRGRAFGMGEKYGGTLDEFFTYLVNPDHKKRHKFLYVLKKWIISPYSCWPNDLGRLGKMVCKLFGAGRDIDRETAALLYFVQDVPDETEQEAVAEKEHLVVAGNYDPYVKNNVKFKLQLKYLQESTEFHGDLKLVSSILNLDDLAYNNVVRRTLACERNIRPDQFYLKWKNKRRRAQHVVDGFCWKHELYGLEKIDGKWVPLLMKVTVNVTPHGIIIFIPKWMSLDLARDLVIREITKLIRARGVKRQGPKRTEGQFEREELAREAYFADQAAIDTDIKGDDKIDFIIHQLGLLPETEERRIRELVAEGEALMNSDESRITPAEVLSKTPASTDESENLAEALAKFDRLSAEEKDKFMKLCAK